MIKVKEFIKRQNETVFTVAGMLELSRPTFDTYISLYESGHSLPKVKYQKIFECLFSDESMMQCVFNSKLNICSQFLEREIPVERFDSYVYRAERTSQVISQLSEQLYYEETEELFYLMEAVASGDRDSIYNRFLEMYNMRDMMEERIRTQYEH